MPTRWFLVPPRTALFLILTFKTDLVAMSSRLSLLFAFVYLVFSGLSASAQSTPVKIVAFAGASNWPLWIGQQKNFFARQDLNIQLDITPNSIEMARNLHLGHYDLAFSSVDNIVAYDEGQGEAELEGPIQFVALFGVDNGLLNVMATPDIIDFSNIRGKSVSVDAMTTGYSFVLRDVLKRKNIDFNDVKWIKVGGGAQRLDALIKKEQSLTLLNSPLDLSAEARGMRRLVHVQDELGPYQGIVAATNKHNLIDKKETLLRFIKGFYQSVNWLADPTNKDEAIAILMTKMPNMPHIVAENAYAVLLDQKNGIYRDLKIDREGMKTVLRLRSTYGMPAKQLQNPERYIDETLLKEVLSH
jgi:ABC-type nitrate/sulfonate/bicarbonate transport system substrate-binding protein